jgi:leader peptidase (prepilin peptidase)/N-methyltransferase
VLLVVCAAVLGLVVGSFLNVVVWRVPRGESIVSPRSACPRCGTPIRPRDNIPVVSWVLLKGRCRDCQSDVSARYPLVEAGTAAVFAAMAARFGMDAALPAYLYLGAIGVALALIDIDVKRLPNVIVLPSYLVGAALLGAAAVAHHDVDELIHSTIGGLALYAFYFLLALVYPAGMGFGDVKLAGVLGMYLGFLGFAELLVGGFLGFLFGGVLGGLLMIVGRAGRKSQIPFGPFMLAGALVAVLWGGALADLYLNALGG